MLRHNTALPWYNHITPVSCLYNAIFRRQEAEIIILRTIIEDSILGPGIDSNLKETHRTTT